MYKIHNADYPIKSKKRIHVGTHPIAPIRSGRFCANEYSVPLLRLIRRCLEEHPDDRISANALLTRIVAKRSQMHENYFAQKKANVNEPLPEQPDALFDPNDGEPQGKSNPRSRASFAEGDDAKRVRPKIRGAYTVGGTARFWNRFHLTLEGYRYNLDKYVKMNYEQMREDPRFCVPTCKGCIRCQHPGGNNCDDHDPSNDGDGHGTDDTHKLRASLKRKIGQGNGGAARIKRRSGGRLSSGSRRLTSSATVIGDDPFVTAQSRPARSPSYRPASPTIAGENRDAPSPEYKPDSPTKGSQSNGTTKSKHAEDPDSADRRAIHNAYQNDAEALSNERHRGRPQAPDNRHAEQPTDGDDSDGDPYGLYGVGKRRARGIGNELANEADFVHHPLDVIQEAQTRRIEARRRILDANRYLHERTRGTRPEEATAPPREEAGQDEPVIGEQETSQKRAALEETQRLFQDEWGYLPGEYLSKKQTKDVDIDMDEENEGSGSDDELQESTPDDKEQDDSSDDAAGGKYGNTNVERGARDHDPITESNHVQERGGNDGRRTDSDKSSTRRQLGAQLGQHGVKVAKQGTLTQEAEVHQDNRSDERRVGSDRRPRRRQLQTLREVRVIIGAERRAPTQETESETSSEDGSEGSSRSSEYVD